jgi:hypothetical protein
MSQRKLHGKYCAVGDSGSPLPEAASFLLKHNSYNTIVSLKDVVRQRNTRILHRGNLCVLSFILL